MPDAIAPGKTPGEPPTVIQTRKPFVGFTPLNVPPSQYIFLQDNDFIVVNGWTNFAGCQIRINYRFLTPTSEIKEGTFFAPLAAAGVVIPFTFQIGEGWLLSLGVQQTTFFLQGQWCFAQIGFTRGINPQVFVQGIIWQGFVPLNLPNGWPGTPSKEITDGAGTLISIQGSTPAAGADISDTVPSERRRQLLSVQANLATSAAVANRQAGVNLDDGVNAFYGFHSTQVQAASLTFAYNFTPGTQISFDTQNSIDIPMPTPTILKAGFRFRTNTFNLQAGDQWSAPKYLLLEWGQVDI